MEVEEGGENREKKNLLLFFRHKNKKIKKSIKCLTPSGEPQFGGKHPKHISNYLISIPTQSSIPHTINDRSKEILANIDLWGFGKNKKTNTQDNIQNSNHTTQSPQKQRKKIKTNTTLTTTHAQNKKRRSY